MTVTSSAYDRRGLFRLGGAGALALGSASVLAACGNSTTATPTTPTTPTSSGSSTGMASFPALNVQLSWIKDIEFAGEYFAIEKGYYTASGIQGMSTTNLLAGGSGPSAEQVVAQGQALVGLSAPSGTGPFNFKAIQNGQAPLVTIAATFQKNPFCLLSLKEGKPIATIADLAGKKIGVQSGTNQVIWEGFLAANNIDPSTVETVPTGFTIDDLIAGKEDAHFSYLTNEPILAQMAGKTPVTLGFADNGLPFSAETYIVTKDTFDNKKDLLKAFLIAEVKGWADAVKDPVQCAKYAALDYGKDQKLTVKEQTAEAKAQAKLIVTSDTNSNGLLTMTDDLIAQNIKTLDLMFPKAKVTADQLFDMSLINEVFSENPDLIVSL